MGNVEVWLRLFSELVALEEYLKPHLEHYYYSHTIEELLGSLFMPLKQNLKQLKDDCETQLAIGCRVRGHKRLNI